ncbi:tryptophan 2,3-dioxygenase family protein [Roseivirga sp. BDSF3-8]|uniref:tryptophan 2,3-dioxygenase family protein n=1 Tax=Roseivirga sp. BDSF3-8 TaxID=3241598 RepID=UPI003532346B
MNYSDIDEKVLDRIQKLKEKYGASGQDLLSYLDGLLYADYLTYWDYIHLDTLLTLQVPRTSFPDENIFIIYHQISELYFKLIRLEMEQLSEAGKPDAGTYLMRLNRINRYFEHLVSSFDVMVDGMDQQQFLAFRMSLLPSSGFQSGQYRLIELQATTLKNLVENVEKVNLSPDADEEKLIQQLYWRKGATELATGNKTLTLRQFEDKYAEEFLHAARKYKDTNLYSLYQQYFSEADEKDALVEALRKLDYLANVGWRLAHYKAAVRYLHKDPEDIAATGGTNWQKYLPPRFQRTIFYPELWSEAEKEDWGKRWVFKEVFNKEE